MRPTMILDDIEIIMLEDGSGTFFSPREEVFPATPEQWADADAFDPGARTEGGEWLLRFRCFALRRPNGRVVLVDAGIGPADAPSASWAPVPGRLPEELADAGIERDDVETVVLTHVHTDHIGWAVTGGTPYFRNARYLLQSADLPTFAFTGPLTEAGQLDLLDGDARLAPGIEIVATPGHTPGHQSVLVHDRLLVTGDLLVHALQLLHPTIEYAHEVDPALARTSRLAALGRLGGDGILATPHLTEPFLRMPAR
ncbi:MBL fold metallo-hydrolase [Hamadaea sp. NPDC051192]|uniref:MBL fold metallo-hydrolase n=1 Tax=Hamadaea sp. NPDC051192 TaxID=3154940 RepID=UPI00344189C4